MLRLRFFALLSSSILLVACGTLTGIPSHGGGKRFAVEQELVAASSRAAIKEMDLSALQGKKVALYISTMGDQGSGNMSGGRYSLGALIRGEYLTNPSTTTSYTYPEYSTTASTTSGTLASQTSSTSVLNAPSQSISQTKGAGDRRFAELSIGGQGDYRNETLITNGRDVSFLSNLVQTLFFLRGIDVVSPEQADTDVFVIVDVFGTIRSRTELHLYNAETLKALTKLEYFAVNRNNRRLLIKPTVSSYEATYQEKYALWAGPFKVMQRIQPAAGLMVDFSDIAPYQSPKNITPKTDSGQYGSPAAPTWQNTETHQDTPIASLESLRREEAVANGANP
ncbi:MAG: hypothetical protein Q4G13_04700 [Moraxella sp.]|nr:hypothetical protein [Moraxella sp.]